MMVWEYEGMSVERYKVHGIDKWVKDMGGVEGLRQWDMDYESVWVVSTGGRNDGMRG